MKIHFRKGAAGEVNVLKVNILGFDSRKVREDFRVAGAPGVPG